MPKPSTASTSTVSSRLSGVQHEIMRALTRTRSFKKESLPTFQSSDHYTILQNATSQLESRLDTAYDHMYELIDAADQAEECASSGRARKSRSQTSKQKELNESLLGCRGLTGAMMACWSDNFDDREWSEDDDQFKANESVKKIEGHIKNARKDLKPDR
jgi:hypothetical protein